MTSIIEAAANEELIAMVSKTNNKEILVDFMLLSLSRHRSPPYIVSMILLYYKRYAFSLRCVLSRCRGRRPP